VALLLLCTQAPLLAENLVLQDVRHWTQGGVTRVAVQLSGKAEIRRDRLSKPERYFFDFQNTGTSKKGMQTIAVGDSLVRQIRIAEAKPGVSRVVLDLVDNADVSTSELSNPYRLVIEIKRPGAKSPVEPVGPEVITTAPASKGSKSSKVFPPPTPRVPSIAKAPILPDPPSLVLLSQFRSALPPAPPFAIPATAKRPLAAKSFAPPPAHSRPVNPNAAILPTPPPMVFLALWRKPAPPAPKVSFPPYRSTATKTAPTTTTAAAKPTPPAPPAQSAQGARRGSTGANSMTRALGLKIRRVVLDPGHGGHDQGSAGPTGLLEKELVLDVALRLGELISANLGSEVVYTRNDDHFVPLETRTKMANDSKADLFVSIHANSSVVRSVSGVETYYLSFTTSKEALDVAARENATSERSVFELRDLLQKIALQEKVDESRDFAARVNASLFRVWGQTPSTRNRGVKKAPFVVLIGASMPSILTEIGFLSNPRDEKELKKSETRQKIAEALYKGIAQYADSLSHFASVRRAEDE
jgi:N-acetylmuramoyl-L-alanine amidase